VKQPSDSGSTLSNAPPEVVSELLQANHSTTSYHLQTALGLLLCAIFLCSLACGKRRPPLPPVEAIPQRTELLSGAQRGNQVILSWPAPVRNAPDQSVQSIRRIDIYRMAEKLDAPLPLTEEEFAARSTLVGSVTAEQIQSAAGTLSYTDTLELAGQPARLRYALRYVNASGQRAAFSNFLLIEPAARIAQPPAITGISESESALTIKWEPPAANIDNSTPVNLLGYNIYRTAPAQTEIGQTPINNALIQGTEYADKNFQFGQQYSYLIRSVSLGTGGAQVESLNSNTRAVTPQDVYAPSAPERISIAPAPGRLSLFWPANPERDVAGYNLYRTTDASLPKERWTKLNNNLLTRTTYQDEAVEPGKKYSYYLTAVDAVGNTSQPSEAASETVP
jgi:fibronectin type 3 domain-containing protein